MELQLKVPRHSMQVRVTIRLHPATVGMFYLAFV